MKKTLTILITFTLISIICGIEENTPGKPEAIKYPFSAGEFLHFTVSYGFMTAGYATIEVHENRNYNGRDVFIFKTTARSRRAFDWIFKVRDRIESYFDKEKAHSLRHIKILREGSYHVDIDIEYDQENLKAYFNRKRKGRGTRNAEIDIPENVMDPLSSLFYVRTLDLKVGDEILIPSTDNAKVYDIKVIVHKIETVRVPAGKFKCFVVEPVMADGGVFKKDGKVQVWLTADEKKMPVKMETKVYIGSITAELGWYISE